jgi:hypothetical protein
VPLRMDQVGKQFTIPSFDYNPQTWEVYPGDKIISELWREKNDRILAQAKTGDGRVVLSNAAATLSG